MGQTDRQTDTGKPMLNVMGREHTNLARSPAYTCRDIRTVFYQLGPARYYPAISRPNSKLLIG